MCVLSFDRVYPAMLDIQVMLLDHHTREDMAVGIDDRGARIIGGRLESEDRKAARSRLDAACPRKRS